MFNLVFNIDEIEFIKYLLQKEAKGILADQEVNLINSISNKLNQKPSKE